MDLGLRGLKAILVGASKGIGRAVGQVMVEEGVELAICAREPGALAQAVQSLQKSGKVRGEAVDAADETALTEWVRSSAESMGGCDIFISFASGGIEDSEAGWKEALALDVMPAWRGIRTALPYLEKSSAASIVVISSTAAIEQFMGPSPYNAIKAGMITYAHSLAQEYAGRAIRVNTITPGPIWIDGGGWQWMKENMAEFYENTLKAIPVGRMGTGEEIARAIAFVASPACRFLTGANLVVDGGFTKGVRF